MTTPTVPGPIDDNRLYDLCREHLRSAGLPTADHHAADFVKRVKTGRKATPPYNDAELWGATSFALGESLDPEQRMIVARQLIAILRRLREPHLRTWGPGDELPSPPPDQIADLDGDVWIHQTAGNGCYRMSMRDQLRYADAIHDYRGVQVWPFLLDAEGPFTEVTTRQEQFVPCLNHEWVSGVPNATRRTDRSPAPR